MAFVLPEAEYQLMRASPMQTCGTLSAHRRSLTQLLTRLITLVNNPVDVARLAAAPGNYLEKQGFGGVPTPDKLPLLPTNLLYPTDPAVWFGQDSNSEVDTASRLLPLSARLVLYGARPMTLLDGDEQTLTQWLRTAESVGLSGLLSAQAYSPADDNTRNGYRNLMGYQEWARPGSGLQRRLLLARDPAWLSCGWVAMLHGLDAWLGLLLGFPACCIASFTQHWPKAIELYNGELSAITLQHTSFQPFPWYMNLYSRYFGYEFLYHFPCQYTCPATISLAQTYCQAMQLFEPHSLDMYRQFLTGAVVVTETEGVIQLSDYRQDGNAVAGQLLVGQKAPLSSYPGTDLHQAAVLRQPIRFDNTQACLYTPQRTHKGHVLFFV